MDDNGVWIGIALIAARPAWLHRDGRNLSTKTESCDGRSAYLMRPLSA